MNYLISGCLTALAIILVSPAYSSEIEQQESIGVSLKKSPSMENLKAAQEGNEVLPTLSPLSNVPLDIDAQKTETPTVDEGRLAWLRRILIKGITLGRYGNRPEDTHVTQLDVDTSLENPSLQHPGDGSKELRPLFDSIVGLDNVIRPDANPWEDADKAASQIVLAPNGQKHIIQDHYIYEVSYVKGDEEKTVTFAGNEIVEHFKALGLHYQVKKITSDLGAEIDGAPQ